MYSTPVAPPAAVGVLNNAVSPAGDPTFRPARPAAAAAAAAVTKAAARPATRVCRAASAGRVCALASGRPQRRGPCSAPMETVEREGQVTPELMRRALLSEQPLLPTA
ncbi:MAG: hypothetical protein AAFR79_21575, partial [Pseudomonadota bacterium]